MLSGSYFSEHQSKAGIRVLAAWGLRA
jgi:hypothetical protein